MSGAYACCYFVLCYAIIMKRTKLIITSPCRIQVQSILISSSIVYGVISNDGLVKKVRRQVVLHNMFKRSGVVEQRHEVKMFVWVESIIFMSCNFFGPLPIILDPMILHFLLKSELDPKILIDH